jgi:hypothetical protein
MYTYTKRTGAEMNYTQDQINAIVREAEQAAYEAAMKFFYDKLGGKDQFACGFAWTNIWGVKGNTKLGKMLKAAGVKQDYTKAFSIWNPSGLGVQNVDTKEAGADAAAEVFKRYGFNATSGSRLD